MSHICRVGLLVTCLAGLGLAQTIDHGSVDAVGTLPQATLDAIGQQKWLFTHASVGGNMIDGMNGLHSDDALTYQLVTTTVGNNGSRANNPPSPTVAGTIYDCNRGNPGWQAKITFFDSSVRVSGWHDSAVTAVLDKMCYIDQDANVTTYLSSTAALEATYPRTAIVYATMPLTTSTDSANILRNEYNAAVRSFCSSRGKLLFDIADIEAHDLAGTEYTFDSGGKTYQRLYPGYSSDGGHLNTAGSRRVAEGWYAVAAVLTAPSAPADLNADGHVDDLDLTLLAACGRGPMVPLEPSTACGRADLNTDGVVDPNDFAILQRCLSGTSAPDPTCR